MEQVGPSGSARSFSDYEPEFRKDYQTNYPKSGATYERYAPAYQYGYKLAVDPRYTKSNWSTIESQAQKDWSREGKGTWEDFKAQSAAVGIGRAAAKSRPICEFEKVFSRLV